MTESKDEQDVHFFQLIISLHAGTMQQMGKIANPVSGKIERNMTAAKNSIDLLEMLKTKTNGNLSESETKMLESALFELRMNYVDEAKKDDKEESASKSADTAADESSSAEAAE